VQAACQKNLRPDTGQRWILITVLDNPGHQESRS
jgi:hypothetical protein